MTIVLHQWEMSPFCNKIRRALRYKGLAFETKNYNGIKALEAGKLSKAGTLPILEMDGEMTVDSPAIAARLDRKVPSPRLYPENPADLAMARFWEDWAGQSLYFFEIYLRMLDDEAMDKAVALICEGRSGVERMMMKMAFKQRYPKKLKAQGIGKNSPEEVEAKLMQHMADFEAILSEREWLVGSAPSIADLSIVAQLDEICRTSKLAPKIKAHAKVRAWMERTPA